MPVIDEDMMQEPILPVDIDITDLVPKVDIDVVLQPLIIEEPVSVSPTNDDPIGITF